MDTYEITDLSGQFRFMPRRGKGFYITLFNYKTSLQTVASESRDARSADDLFLDVLSRKAPISAPLTALLVFPLQDVGRGALGWDSRQPERGRVQVRYGCKKQLLLCQGQPR